MSDRLLHGERVSDEQIQAWVDEAERGYDLTKLAPPLPGRPRVGNGPGVDATRPVLPSGPSFAEEKLIPRLRT